MVSDKPIVYVVDDDESLRRALERMLRLYGYRVGCFASAEEFLKEPLEAQVCCMLLDLQLPGLNGLELQNSLLQRGHFVPIIFISGHGTIPAAIRAIKSGAVTFLTKPFAEEELIAEVERAMAVCRNEVSERSKLTRIKQCFETLTARESEIFESVVNGKLNKQTASDLGIVLNTVKVHRRRVMRKMHAESLADLVVMAQKLRASTETGPAIARHLSIADHTTIAVPSIPHLTAGRSIPPSAFPQVAAG